MPLGGYTDTVEVRDHHCRWKPPTTFLRKGRLWACPICGTQWVVDGYYSDYWMVYGVDQRYRFEEVWSRGSLTGRWWRRKTRRRVPPKKKIEPRRGHIWRRRR
jgi:hypothetical protein